MEYSQTQLEDQLSDMMWGHFVSASLRAVAELGVADHLKDGPRTAPQMAQEIGCHPQSLHRLLRALATVGIVAQENAHFSLTPLGALLRSDIPRSQRGKALELCRYLDDWEQLTVAVKTGKAPREDPYDVILDTDENSELFYDAMDSFFYGNPAPMLGVYDFSGMNVVADIGCGSGNQLSAILAAHPGMRGILFDRPDTIGRIGAQLSPEIRERVDLVGGDFFKAVPAGADLYILRHIIHNWDDEKSAQILRNVASVLPANGRVLVVEVLMPDENPHRAGERLAMDDPAFAPWWDLTMFVGCNGAERTTGEYAALFANAGLKLNRVLATDSDVSLVEGIRG